MVQYSTVRGAFTAELKSLRAIPEESQQPSPTGLVRHGAYCVGRERRCLTLVPVALVAGEVAVRAVGPWG
jgi:hypothetical protein